MEVILHVEGAMVGTILELVKDTATLVSVLPVAAPVPPAAPQPRRPRAPRAAPTVTVRLPPEPTPGPVPPTPAPDEPDPPAAREPVLLPTPPPTPVERTTDGRLKTPRGERRGENLVLEFMRAARGPVLVTSLDRVLASHGYAPGGASARLSTLKAAGKVTPLGEGRWALRGHTKVHLGATARGDDS